MSHLKFANIQFCHPVLAYSVNTSHFSKMSRSALWTNQSPFKLEAGFFPQGWSGKGVKLTTHLYLVVRWRMHEEISLLHPYAFKEYTGSLFFLLACNWYRMNSSSSERSSLFCLMLTLKCIMEYGGQLQEYNQSSTETHTSVDWHAVWIKCCNKQT